MSEPRTIIVGAGIAGLTSALRLSPRPVTLIANAPMGQGVASGWSQGGIAAALAQGDSPNLHLTDSLLAASGIADLEAIKIITKEASTAIGFLADCGVNFDRDAMGQYALSKEAAHSRSRIVRVAGDLTGPGIMAALRHKVAETPSISIRTGFEAVELCVSENKIYGIWVADPQHNLEFIPTNSVILATGGIGYLYRNTSNPRTACGAGIALAARAGAKLADMEFVQFHPTTLAVGKDPSPLATEALRGEGAILINERKERFMVGIHPDAELAPRDVVARSIFEQILAGHHTYLDCRDAIGTHFDEKFPKVFALCQDAGIDPRTQPIPVEPAAHYHMGGVATDAMARTSIAGLWACGEVACTGAHGANRLASNSLLEAVVFSKRAAKDIDQFLSKSGPLRHISSTPNFIPDNVYHKSIELSLRQIMRDYVGVIRHRDSLITGIKRLEDIANQPNLSTHLSNMLLVARVVALFSLWREESRGSHFRTDFPAPQSHWERRQFFTLDECINWLSTNDIVSEFKKSATF